MIDIVYFKKVSKILRTNPCGILEGLNATGFPVLRDFGHFDAMGCPRPQQGSKLLPLTRVLGGMVPNDVPTMVYAGVGVPDH